LSPIGIRCQADLARMIVFAMNHAADALGWCHDNQYNDIKHNDIQPNDIQHNNKENATLSILAESCYAICH
jgi:hypothetical protein